MKISKHFKKRMDQRGISDTMVNIIYDYGELKKARDGAIRLEITEKASREIEALCKYIIEMTRRSKGRSIVLDSESETGITAY